MRALGAVVAVVLGGLAAGVLPAAADTVLGHPPGPPSARERLLLLAAAAGPAAADGSTGRYSRVHLVRWVRSGTAVARIDSERWRAPDGSGRVSERRVDPPGPGSTVDYSSGELPMPPVDPTADPTAIVTSLLDMIGVRYLDRPERAAALRTIAGLPGLAAAGQGFSVPVGATRLTIELDPGTGEIVAWQYGDAERVEVLSRERVADLP
ncbi:hypothetical protein ABT369_07920 [Dactylosporangium sp. NPDC000244]|uniref:hypothetical protein n=1 Tax=Dactylosporangium sp. NPDC000244 TaxID=3154365 RepID=UPI003319352B